jgi:hypothetical protein
MIGLVTATTGERIEPGQLAAIAQGNGLRPAVIDDISVRGAVFARFLTPDATAWDKPRRVEVAAIEYLLTPKDVQRRYTELPRAPQ